MARAQGHLPDDEPQPTFDLHMVALPTATVRALNEAAAARGMTFAQGLARAIRDFVRTAEGQNVRPTDD